MKVIKQLFNFYINASIHVALAVFALTRVTMMEFGTGSKTDISYALFFGTIVGYNFLKYAEGAGNYLFVRRKPVLIIQAFSFLCFLLAAYFMISQDTEVYLWIGGLVLITFLYLVPLKIFGGNLRGFVGMKVYIVALVWAFSTVFLPVVDSPVYITGDVILTAVQRFLFVIIIMIPFEIRDLKQDDEGLHTLPQKYGIKKVKTGGILLLIPFYFLEFFKDNVHSQNLMVLPILSVVTACMIAFATARQPRYYSSFWVESLSILWWVLECLF